MEQILEMNIKDLAALIAAIVAISGLIITSILNILKRRDELIESQLRHFQEISNGLANDSIALRSVCLQNISHYLNDKRFCETTRGILVNNLLFEKDRHLQSQTLELLISDESNLKETMKDLIKLNRLTWNLMIKSFMNAKKTNDTKMIEVDNQLLQTLEITKLGISRILQSNTFVDVDLSNTRLDGINLQNVELKSFNLSGATLSFANLKNAKILDCNLSLSVFAGAYMENTVIIQPKLYHTVFCKARFRNALLESPIEESLNAYFSNIEGLNFTITNTLIEQIQKQANQFKLQKIIICFERELDWQGIWVTKSKKLLNAFWHSDLGTHPVTGDIEFQTNRIIRTSCSDGNNGEYYIEKEGFLDTLERYSLLMGTRILKSGIPSPWHSIKWAF